jgi:PAS domain S-box-containing protein
MQRGAKSIPGLAFQDERLDPAQQSLSLCDIRRPDQPLIYVNRGFERMTGYTPSQVIGRNCRMLQGPDTDPATVQRIREAIAAGEPLIVDLLNYRKDGSRFWNRLSLRPVRDPKGVPTHMVGIQTDITHLRALEDRLFGFAQELAGGPRRSED